MAPRDTPTTPSSAAFDALRTLACVLTTGFVAGALVVGFGGRLVMRVLAATSGGGARVASPRPVNGSSRSIGAIIAASAVYGVLTDIV